MIQITYSADQKALAEHIRDDLAQADYQPAQSVLLVLVSAESNSDPSVQAEVKQAQQQNIQIIPILAESAMLPDSLDMYKPLNFSKGYNRRALITRLAQTTMTVGDVKQANRRALVFIGGIALVMFLAAVFGIMGGLVAFPVDEYNEEATLQAGWVNGIIVETLEFVQPRTTQDALEFESTLEAVPTRLYLYIRGTATAIPNSQGD